MNHAHYNVEDQEYIVQEDIKNHKLSGPMFIGQGLSKRVGSDEYGFYIVDKKTVGKKTMWGIAMANTVMHGDWTEGNEDCSIDLATAKVYEWIIQSGWWKDKKTGVKLGPKFYYCDENGNKFNGRKACFGWNGAYSYRNPSF